MSDKERDDAINLLVIGSQSDEDLLAMIVKEGSYVIKYRRLFEAIEEKFNKTKKLTEQHRQWFVSYLANNGKSKS